MTHSGHLQAPPPLIGGGAANRADAILQLALSADTCSVSKRARNLAIAPQRPAALFGVTNFTQLFEILTRGPERHSHDHPGRLVAGVAMLCGTPGGMNT